MVQGNRSIKDATQLHRINLETPWVSFAYGNWHGDIASITDSSFPERPFKCPVPDGHGGHEGDSCRGRVAHTPTAGDLPFLTGFIL